MKIPLPGGKLTAVIVTFAAGFLLQSCSYTVMPRNVPFVAANEAASFKGVSVLVVNAAKETGESPIRTEAGRSSAFRGNKSRWSQKLVESLARELARRGADVRATAPVTVSVAVTEVVLRETRELLEFKAKAVVSATSGWTGEYKGAASIETSRIFSLSEEADRLAGRALAEITKAVITDSDFAAQLKIKQSPPH